MGHPTRLRVLRITPFFYHDCVTQWPARYDAVGGMQVQIWRASDWLARNDVEQLVVTTGVPEAPRAYTSRPNLHVRIVPLLIPEVRSELTGLIGLLPSWFVGALLTCVRLKRTYQPHCIHVHGDGQIYPLWIVHFLKRLFAVPVVLTIHCSRLSVYRPMSKFDALQHKLAQAAEVSAAREASQVISLTEATRESIGNHTGLSGDRIRVIPDTIEPDQFRALVRPADHPALRERFGLHAGRPVVAYVGRIAHEKGWKHLIPVARAARHLNPHFLVIGDGPQRERMERELQTAGVRTMFTITGFVPNYEVPSLLSLADLVVMPSVHEEFGGTALEAFSLGRPVAGFEVGGLRHILGSTMPELMAAPEDSAGLSDRVLTVLQNPEYFRSLGSQACGWVRESYSSSRVLPRLLGLYQSQVTRGVAIPRENQQCGRTAGPSTTLRSGRDDKGLW